MAKGHVGSHLKHHVACKEHSNHVPSYDAVPDEGSILTWGLWMGQGGTSYIFGIFRVNRFSLADVESGLVDH